MTTHHPGLCLPIRRSLLVLHIGPCQMLAIWIVACLLSAYIWALTDEPRNDIQSVIMDLLGPNQLTSTQHLACRKVNEFINILPTTVNTHTSWPVFLPPHCLVLRFGVKIMDVLRMEEHRVCHRDSGKEELLPAKHSQLDLEMLQHNWLDLPNSCFNYQDLDRGVFRQSCSKHASRSSYSHSSSPLSSSSSLNDSRNIPPPTII